ncbi:hypothetical protein M5K25_026064 [Dendrobium thyrsiflorum]|uniref:Endonuclease/exonuclease/phosphatase domain-containing protein n=1 Tax=Dendrobium thyrsiflorum TaxID=117978 RepID=A0ABD0TWC8_DENTH
MDPKVLPNPWGSPPCTQKFSGSGFLNAGEKPSSRSFKDVVSGLADGFTDGFAFKKSSVKGVPAILFSDEDVVKLASPFQFTLVDLRNVAIQLSNDLDYSRIFSRCSYYINNCQMRLLKWTPYFDIKEESPIVPIWISFPNLRLHFFNHHVMLALGSIFGRPLQTDHATASRSRPSVARVLVEMDITKNHPKEIWVGSESMGYLQKVVFENVPDFSSHCKIHGHSISECFVLHPNLKNVSKEVDVHGKSNAGMEEVVGIIHESSSLANVIHKEISGDIPIVPPSNMNVGDPAVSNEGINTDKGKFVVPTEETCAQEHIDDLKENEPSNDTYISGEEEMEEGEIDGTLKHNDIISDFPQIVHTNITFQILSFFGSFVYASCTRQGRSALWKQLTDFSSVACLPWFVGGDFNVISKTSERIGGNMPCALAMDDFNRMILNCNLHDIGFSGSNFTWNRSTMWQRLDRVLFNGDWISKFPLTHIEHLSRTMSDHSPLLLNFNSNSMHIKSSFRFQNMWLLDEDFYNILKCNWNAPLFPDDNIQDLKKAYGLNFCLLSIVVSIIPYCVRLRGVTLLFGKGCVTLSGKWRSIFNGSAMASFVPSVTFCFGSDGQVTLPESLLACPPVGGITFGSFTDSAFVTLGGPTPSEAAALSPPQRRARAAMRPFGRPAARRTARAPPTRPVARRPVPPVPVAPAVPAPQRRQPVVPSVVVPAEVTRARVSPPPSSSRKRSAQAKIPSPSTRRVSAFARLSHPEIVRQTPTPPVPVVPVPAVVPQAVGPDLPSSSTSGLGRRARRNRNRRLRLAASEAEQQQMAVSLAHQEPVAPEIEAVQGGRFSPLTHSGDEEDVARIAAAPPITTILRRARVPRDGAARTLTQRIRSIIRLARRRGPVSRERLLQQISQVHTQSQRQLSRQRHQWRRGQPPRQQTTTVTPAGPQSSAPTVGRRPRRRGRRQQLEPAQPRLSSVVVAPPPIETVVESRRSRWVWRRRQADPPAEVVQPVGQSDAVAPQQTEAVLMLEDGLTDVDEVSPPGSLAVRAEPAPAFSPFRASSSMGPYIEALRQNFSDRDFLDEGSEDDLLDDGLDEDIPVHRVCVVTRRGHSGEQREFEDDDEEQGDAEIGGSPRSVDTDATVLQLQAQMAEMAKAMATMTAQLTALGAVPQAAGVGTPATSRDEAVVPPVLAPGPVGVDRVQRTVPVAPTTVTHSLPVQSQPAQSQLVQMTASQIQDLIAQKVEQAISSRKSGEAVSRGRPYPVDIPAAVPPKVESQQSRRPQRQESSGAPPPRRGEVHSTYGPQDKGKKPLVSSVPPPQQQQPYTQGQSAVPPRPSRRTPESQQYLQEKLSKEYPFKRESVMKIFKFLDSDLVQPKGKAAQVVQTVSDVSQRVSQCDGQSSSSRSPCGSEGEWQLALSRKTKSLIRQAVQSSEVVERRPSQAKSTVAIPIPSPVVFSSSVVVPSEYISVSHVCNKKMYEREKLVVTSEGKTCPLPALTLKDFVLPPVDDEIKEEDDSGYFWSPVPSSATFSSTRSFSILHISSSTDDPSSEDESEYEPVFNIPEGGYYMDSEVQGPSQVGIEAGVATAGPSESPFQSAIRHDVPPSRGRGWYGGRGRVPARRTPSLDVRIPPPSYLQNAPLVISSDSSDDEMIDAPRPLAPSPALGINDHNSFPTFRRYMIPEGGLVIDSSSDEEADLRRQNTIQQASSSGASVPSRTRNHSVSALSKFFVPPQTSECASLSHSIGAPLGPEIQGPAETAVGR